MSCRTSRRRSRMADFGCRLWRVARSPRVKLHAPRTHKLGPLGRSHAKFEHEPNPPARVQTWRWILRLYFSVVEKSEEAPVHPEIRPGLGRLG